MKKPEDVQSYKDNINTEKRNACLDEQIRQWEKLLKKVDKVGIEGIKDIIHNLEKKIAYKDIKKHSNN